MWGRCDPDAAFWHLEEKFLSGEPASWNGQWLVEHVLEGIAATDPKRALAWTEMPQRLKLPYDLTQVYLQWASIDYHAALSAAPDTWTERAIRFSDSPKSALQWAKDTYGVEATPHIDWILRNWDDIDPKSASQWLLTQSEIVPSELEDAHLEAMGAVLASASNTSESELVKHLEALGSGSAILQAIEDLDRHRPAKEVLSLVEASGVRLDDYVVRELAVAWASDEPVQAIKWLRERKIYQTIEGEVIGVIIDGWAARNEDAAFDYLLTHKGALGHWMPDTGEVLLRALHRDVGLAENLVRAHAETSPYVVGPFLMRYAKIDRDRALEFAEELGAHSDMGTLVDGFDFETVVIEDSVQWVLQNMQGKPQQSALKSLAHNLANQRTTGLSEYLRTMEPGLTRDVFIEQLLGALPKKQSAEALRWSLGLSDEGARARRSKAIVEQWPYPEPGEIEAVLDAAKL